MKSDSLIAGSGGVGSLIPSSYWILSPVKDLSLVILTPLLVLLVYGLAGRWGWIDSLIAFGLVLAIAHYLPGIFRAYGDRALFRRYRTRLLVAPLVLFSATLSLIYLQMTAVTVVLMWWGSWHWMMQSYGFARIYDAKAGSISKDTARLDQTLCLFWFVTAAFFIHRTFTVQLRDFYECGVPFVPASFLDAFRVMWLVATGLVTVWWLLHMVRMSRQGYPPNPWKIIFLGVTFTFLAYTGSLAAEPLLAYVMFETCHDIQYLAIVWMFNCNRAEKDEGAGRFIRFLFRPRLVLVGLYVVCCLAFGMLSTVSYLVDTSYAYNMNHVIKFTAALVAMLAMLHYYLDGFIWKIRDKSTRETLGVESETPEQQPQRGVLTAVAFNGGWRHGLLWLLFFVPIALLSITKATDRAPKGLDAYKKVVESMPSSARANFVYCGMLLEGSQFDESLSVCRKAVQLAPGSARTQSNLAFALYGVGRYEEAIAHYQEALRIKPNDAKAHNDLGKSLHALGRSDEAIGHFQDALRIKPDYAEAHNEWGLALAKLGRLEESARRCREALRLKPNFADAHNNLGAALQGMGRPQEAVTHYQEALRFNPDYVEAHYNVGLALTGLGRVDEAVSHYQEAVRIQPDLAEGHFHLGLALTRLGRVNEAVTHYLESLRIKPDDAEAHHNLGTALQATGRLAEAVAHYQDALQIQPDHAGVHNNLAWLLATCADAEIRDGRLALKHAQHAAGRTGENNPSALDTLAAAYAETGNFELAVRWQMKAVQIAPETRKDVLRGRLELYKQGKPFREKPLGKSNK